MLGAQSIDGIVSGLDTRSIIDAIIQFERRNAVVLEAQKINKTNIISSFQAVQAKLLALSSNLMVLTRSSTFTKSSITVSDDTILHALSNGKVASGSYDIEVMDIARNHQIASQGFASGTDVLFGTGTISLTVGDGATQQITIDSSNNTLIGLKKAINDADVGVTASIINDGSSSNPFRLLLSVDKTGVANKMSISSNLSGGLSPNFTTTSFDVPENLNRNIASTSIASLGPTASYTGSTNKIYTFTVAGSGSQTIGTDNITINYTDGTNSGSIIITQADTEFALVGDGSDGLKLSFSAGTLNAGDTFQVQTFAPTLQEATDAKIGFGSTGGNGSPIIVTSDTNDFEDVIGGLTLTVDKVTDPGETINLIVDLDVKAIRDTFNSFINSYNDVMEFIDKQNTFDADSETGGILLGDLTLQRTQNQIRRTLSSTVEGLSGSFKQMFAVGLRTGPTGKLALRDSKAFEDALRNNLDDVIKMFGDSGVSSSSFIEYVSQNSATKVGTDYKVDVTAIATKGRMQGSEIVDPATTPLVLTSTTNRLKFNLGGLLSDEIVLTAKTYNTGAELAAEIQKQLDADDKLGDKETTVEWVATSGGNGHLEFTTRDYGSAAKISNVTSIPNSALSILGIANAQIFEGTDVAGTINGEKATGIGQFLTGDEDNKNTEGLKLKITLGNTQLLGEEEGTISVIKGIATKLGDLLTSVTRSGDGLLDSRIRGERNQIQNLTDRIKAIDDQMERRRERLQLQFLAMEAALGQFGIQQQFLSQQLANISINFQPR